MYHSFTHEKVKKCIIVYTWEKFKMYHSFTHEKSFTKCVDFDSVWSLLEDCGGEDVKVQWLELHDKTVAVRTLKYND